MILILTNTQGQTCRIADLYAWALRRSVDTPCDSLYAEFPAQITGEIETVEAWAADTLLFRGQADTQTMVYGAFGGSMKLWARSMAACLVDNECMPCSYQMPTAETLFLKYAAELGLKNCLPPILLPQTFDIEKGTSRWGALDRLVRHVSGEQIYVNSLGELGVFTPLEPEITFSDGNEGMYQYIDAAHTVKRCKPIARVIYKTEIQSGYCHMAEQPEFMRRHIGSTRYLNLSALEPWRRQAAVDSLLVRGNGDYDTVTLTLAEIPRNLVLYQRAIFVSSKLDIQKKDMLVTGIDYQKNSKGTRCQIRLAARAQREIAYSMCT